MIPIAFETIIFRSAASPPQRADGGALLGETLDDLFYGNWYYLIAFKLIVYIVIFSALILTFWVWRRCGFTLFELRAFFVFIGNR